jgi:hypothetical protein
MFVLGELLRGRTSNHPAASGTANDQYRCQELCCVFHLPGPPAAAKTSTSIWEAPGLSHFNRPALLRRQLLQRLREAAATEAPCIAPFLHDRLLQIHGADFF